MTTLSPKKIERSRKDVCVCILAHNEQKHIASTIKSIVEGNREVDFKLVVYANGCTDDTEKIVKSLFVLYPNLQLRELKKASKPLAWNAAFLENKNSILIFSDGDVQPELGSVLALYNCLKKNTAITLVSCQYWPQIFGLSFEQKFTGLLQIPLVQDFLTGCFYAVRRENLVNEFKKQGVIGIPDGVVGEDLFIELLVPEHDFAVIEKKCFYEPPIIKDYMKYLARMRWQEEQIVSVFGSFFPDSSVGWQRGLLAVLKRKLLYSQGIGRFLRGILAATTRCIFIFIFQKKINRYRQSLGPVVEQGGSVLSSATRSSSAK